MELYELLPILLFSISATFTPGPNNIMMMNSGLNFGLKKSMPHYLGICIGFPIMMGLVALGFGAVFIKYTWLRDLLKIVGSAYILYLSWCIAFSKPKNNAGEGNREPFSFLKAVLFQWINPKAWLMSISAVSIFSLTASYFHNALLVGIVFFLACVPCVGIWLMFGTALQRVLKEERYRRYFNILMGLGLAASVLLIFV